jgi:hypothetical protein
MSRVGIVAHDAGGAEILASYVQQENLDCLFVLGGPAEQIFRHRIGPLQTVSLRTAVKECEWMLTGTGWQTDLEWQAIRESQSAGKHTITFLDHWVNYKSRFIRNGVESLPDEIWVGDQHAFSLARNTFPNISIRLIENPYFKYFLKEFEIVSAVSRRSRGNKLNVLFVCENYEGKFHKEHPIRFLMSNLDSFGADIDQIVIRPHPSETVDKYVWVRQEFGCTVSLSSGQPLLNEIVESDIVAGCSSMAMVLGLLAQRRVISCIPDNEIPLTLPFKEIEHLSDIIQVKRREN